MAAFSPSLFLLAICTLGFLLVVRADDSPPEPERCNETLTKEQEGILLSKYPDLHKLVDATDNPAGNKKFGSVRFLNAQDKLFEMECPCGDSAKWKLYNKKDEEEEKEFSEKEYKDKKIKPRTPKPQNYFRTYECSADNKVHYFNVFTRPLPSTTFPIQWVEGSGKDTVHGEALEFKCEIKTVTADDHGPYKIEWILRGTENDGYTLIQLSDSEDIKNETVQLQFFGNHTALDEKKKMNVTSAIVKSISDSADLKSAGHYECVAIDANGLSSSFRRDWVDEKDSKEPPMRFLGDAHVHVRGKDMVWIPLGVFGGAVVLFVVLIFACPDRRGKAGDEGSGGKAAKGKAGDVEQQAQEPKLDLHPSETAAADESQKKKRRKKKKKPDGSDADESESEILKSPVKSPQAPVKA